MSEQRWDCDAATCRVDNFSGDRVCPCCGGLGTFHSTDAEVLIAALGGPDVVDGYLDDAHLAEALDRGYGVGADTQGGES